MSARDELAELLNRHGEYSTHEGLADIAIADGYRKPRTITTAAQLEALPFGSAVQTSDPSDVVVLRCEGHSFRNQSGCDLSATDLWRYGTQPFTVIYEPAVIL
jgi:hypothetical protein